MQSDGLLHSCKCNVISADGARETVPRATYGHDLSRGKKQLQATYICAISTDCVVVECSWRSGWGSCRPPRKPGPATSSRAILPASPTPAARWASYVSLCCTLAVSERLTRMLCKAQDPGLLPNSACSAELCKPKNAAAAVATWFGMSHKYLHLADLRCSDHRCDWGSLRTARCGSWTPTSPARR